jgi:gas vesicle protein
MKKTLATALLLFTSIAFSAPAEIINQYTADFMGALNSKVQLTQEQETALKPILFNNINAREDVISSYMGQTGLGVKMQIRDALQPINEKMQAEAQAVLTPEQFDAFKAVQQKNQESVKSRINKDF